MHFINNHSSKEGPFPTPTPIPRSRGHSLKKKGKSLSQGCTILHDLNVDHKNHNILVYIEIYYLHNTSLFFHIAAAATIIPLFHIHRHFQAVFRPDPLTRTRRARTEVSCWKKRLDRLRPHFTHQILPTQSHHPRTYLILNT